MPPSSVVPLSDVAAVVAEPAARKALQHMALSLSSQWACIAPSEPSASSRRSQSTNTSESVVGSAVREKRPGVRESTCSPTTVDHDGGTRGGAAAAAAAAAATCVGWTCGDVDVHDGVGGGVGDSPSPAAPAPCVSTPSNAACL